MPARRRCAPQPRPATPHRKTGAAARPEGRRRSAAWTDHVSPAGFPCVPAPKAALGRSGAWPGGPFAVRSRRSCGNALRAVLGFDQMNEGVFHGRVRPATADRSEEHTSELQSLMRNTHAALCLKKTNMNKIRTNTEQT